MVFVTTGLCLGPGHAAEEVPEAETEAVVSPEVEDIVAGGTIQSLTFKKDVGIRDAMNRRRINRVITRIPPRISLVFDADVSR